MNLPPLPEPVGHLYTIAGVQHCTITQALPDCALYTHPPATREPLTEKQLANAVRSVPEPEDDNVGIWVVGVCRAIEAAHGIGAQP